MRQEDHNFVPSLRNLATQGDCAKTKQNKTRTRVVAQCEGPDSTPTTATKTEKTPLSATMLY